MNLSVMSSVTVLVLAPSVAISIYVGPVRLLLVVAVNVSTSPLAELVKATVIAVPRDAAAALVNEIVASAVAIAPPRTDTADTNTQSSGTGTRTDDAVEISGIWTWTQNSFANVK